MSPSAADWVVKFYYLLDKFPITQKAALNLPGQHTCYKLDTLTACYPIFIQTDHLLCLVFNDHLFSSLLASFYFKGWDYLRHLINARLWLILDEILNALVRLHNFTSKISLPNCPRSSHSPSCPMKGTIARQSSVWTGALLQVGSQCATMVQSYWSICKTTWMH